jgi:hypothetical protein
VHTTEAGERRMALLKEAKELYRKAKTLEEAAKILPQAKAEARRYQVAANKSLERAQALKLDVRLEDLHVWKHKKVFQSKNGEAKTYISYMATWREGKKVKNVYLGSSQKVTREQALDKARELKKAALLSSHG